MYSYSAGTFLSFIARGKNVFSLYMCLIYKFCYFNYCRITKLSLHHCYINESINSKKCWYIFLIRRWYIFLTWSYLQIIAMWKLLIDFRECNPQNLITEMISNDLLQVLNKHRTYNFVLCLYKGTGPFSSKP